MKTEDLNYIEAIRALLDGSIVEDAEGLKYKVDSTITSVLIYDDYNDSPYWGTSVVGLRANCAPFKIIQPEKRYLKDVMELTDPDIKELRFNNPFNGNDIHSLESDAGWFASEITMIKTFLDLGVPIEIVDSEGDE